MELTPLNMLLLMKLDAFGIALLIFGLIFSGAAWVSYAWLFSRRREYICWPSLWVGEPPASPVFKKSWFIVGMLLILMGVAVPTTKQAAVAFVVPPLINSEFVQKELPAEAHEVYDLAKVWLKDIAKTKQEAPRNSQ